MTEELHYWNRGTQDAPAVVLLHGFMGTGADFERLVALCTGERHFILVDLPGHGKSIDCLPDNQPANLVWMAGQVARLLEGLPQEEFDLFGYSMGGRIALYVALEFGDKIRSLTLESASPGLGDEDQRRRRRVADARRAEELRDQPLRKFLDHWYDLKLFADLKEHSEFEAMMRRRLTNDRGAIARVIEEMSPGAQRDLWPELERLELPTRWIAGAEDAKYVDICTRAARLSGGQVQIVDNAGHTVHLEAPGAIRQLWLSSG